MESPSPHQPVLYQQVLECLRPTSPGLYVDCTVGAGGHAYGILEASSPKGLLLGLDLDPAALEISKQRLSPFSERVILRHSTYTEFPTHLHELGWKKVNGILIDLGVSSMQLDQRERGFSFLHDAPLDMRFDPGSGRTAAELVNRLDEEELAGILWRYGEEHQSRKIARQIVRNRPIHSTGQLANVIENAIGKKGRIHPATRSFQAIRIAVNEELKALETVLPLAVEHLTPGGRLAVISFHSLEDRIVKQFFRQESQDCICPPQQPVCTCHHKASLKPIIKGATRPTKGEIEHNIRSRSARLRCAEILELA